MFFEEATSMLIRAWQEPITIKHFRVCCNQIQQYSPFIMYAMWLKFNKTAEICVAILDDQLFFFVFSVIQ